MNETIKTFNETGSYLLWPVIAAGITVLLLVFSRRDPNPGANNSAFVVQQYVAIPLAVASLGALWFFGLSTFTPIYASPNASELVPLQESSSLGGYITVNDDHATFTIRSGDGTLDAQTVPITAAAAASDGVYFKNPPVVSIIDDATDTTARFETQSCTLVSAAGEKDTKPWNPVCTERQALHVPPVDTATK